MPILVEVAKRRQLITFKDLMNRMGGPGRAYIGQVLETSNYIELSKGHPKISAIVIRRATGMVGGGFFGLSDTPKTLKRTTPEEYQDSHLNKADKDYLDTELEKVYQYWKTHNL